MCGLSRLAYISSKISYELKCILHCLEEQTVLFANDRETENGFHNSIYGLFKLKPASLLQKISYYSLNFVKFISFRGVYVFRKSRRDVLINLLTY